jgi:hypothetical protein
MLVPLMVIPLSTIYLREAINPTLYVNYPIRCMASSEPAAEALSGDPLRMTSDGARAQDVVLGMVSFDLSR